MDRNGNSDKDEDPLTALTLSTPSPTITTPPPPPPPTTATTAPRPDHQQRRYIQQPPFPWLGNVRAKVPSLGDLRSRGISKIPGEVQCKRCNHTSKMDFNLEEKFKEVHNFFTQNIADMNARAPDVWMSPVLLNCGKCNQKNSVRPVISEDAESINWLFLFLGQTLGCCTLHQLKYFLQHNNIHRTGAKDRLVYSTYFTLCRHLQPNWPFSH